MLSKGYFRSDLAILQALSSGAPLHSTRRAMDQDKKPYKFPWYTNVMFFIAMGVPAALILTAGWFLGVLVEALL